MLEQDSKPLLRPNQVIEMTEEKARLESMLSAPPHVASAIQNPGELRRQLHGIVNALETQAPKVYKGTEADDAIREERALREKIVAGMPTQAEMRRNPAGARDKHMRWEKRVKSDVMKWKNIRLRMHASGMLDEVEGASDIANVEVLRPENASHELNMHNEQIPGKTQFGPYAGKAMPTVFSDEDKAALNSIDPEIANSLAALNNDQRAAVKEFLQGIMAPEPVEIHEDYQAIKDKQIPGGVKWTPERRKAHGEKIRAGISKKK